MSNVVSLADARTVETPAATMRTYSSPSTARSADVSVWRTEMQADASGPVHTIDVTHVVVILAGTLSARIDDDNETAAAGDCVLLPAGSQRQLNAGPDGVTTLTAALPGSIAKAGEADAVRVPWAN